MLNLVWHIITNIIGLWLATLIVAGIKIEVIPGLSGIFGIQFTETWQVLALIGSVLGLINFFIRPILDTITLPLKILTLGLFSLFINMIIVWVLDVIFPELTIVGIIPLFWTVIILWLINLFLGAYKKT